ncbi:unnamed protein product [Orchesella dallaii]|uniref:Uncharacterized protein n=1 Tax=Orchesella dallaii TaxID=48710 RepID=A0ABP1RJG0_9HEXA
MTEIRNISLRSSLVLFHLRNKTSHQMRPGHVTFTKIHTYLLSCSNKANPKYQSIKASFIFRPEFCSTFNVQGRKSGNIAMQCDKVRKKVDCRREEEQAERIGNIHHIDFAFALRVS